ncbi:hypothetical protein ACFPMF_08390 [Larkinella bovis]|uniref:Uncharacterized protein n=1 Tax=Larkinella bovis TaxID=683041 RepID=A0ABW0I9X4_9BACT
MESSKKSLASPDRLQLDYCRTENQRRALELTHYKQETNQLLALLDDVLAHYNHAGLRHRAIDYHQQLSRLKTWFNRMQSELICESGACTADHPVPCGAVRFSRTSLLPVQFVELSEDFARTKAGCYQFLSVIVQLNLM